MNNMQFNRFKIKTNNEPVLTPKTPKAQNFVQTPKSNYNLRSNTIDDLQTYYNRFSSISYNNPLTTKENRNKSHNRSIIKNEDNKIGVRSISKGPYEVKKSITLYENNFSPNSNNEPFPNFSHDPKTTRYAHKPFENKFSIKDTYSSKDYSNYQGRVNEYTPFANEERNKNTMENFTPNNNNTFNYKTRKDYFSTNETTSNINTNNKNFNFVSNEKNRESMNVMKLLNDQNFIPLSTNNLNLNFVNYNNSRYSAKSMSIIKAYSANTYQGIVRNYNEDRVSIILNIVKPSSYKGDYWPKCSFFGIYDGHGGSGCADFLRDKLHQYIIKDPNFPSNVNVAIKNAFEAADKDFLFNIAINRNGEIKDRSGSCAIIALIVDNICYIANVGDSRATLSADEGEKIIQISEDHKPNEYLERKRIIDAGGSVYQTQTPARNFDVYLSNTNPNQILLGPYRVFPGRLSVSRAFGDVEAKLTKYGGNPNVLISTPEIKSFHITKDVDFIVIGCKNTIFNYLLGDGIFDQLSNEDVINCVWMSVEDASKSKTIHEYCGTAIDMIIKSSLSRKSLDNVTCVIIAFENFERILNLSDSFNNRNYKQQNERLSLKVSEPKSPSSFRRNSKQNTDGKIRPKTDSVYTRINNQNYGNVETFNYNTNINDHNSNLPRKASPSLFNNRQKKIFLDLSPASNKENDSICKINENRKNLGKTQSLLEKYKISPYNINEINSHYPLTTKNFDSKYKSYNNTGDPKKIITFRNYGI